MPVNRCQQTLSCGDLSHFFVHFSHKREQISSRLSLTVALFMIDFYMGTDTAFSVKVLCMYCKSPYRNSESGSDVALRAGILNRSIGGARPEGVECGVRSLIAIGGSSGRLVYFFVRIVALLVLYQIVKPF